MHSPYLRIKFERHKRNWNQREVGQLMKTHGGHHRAMTQNEISQIELGRLVTTEAELEALARVFKISPASVLLKPCTVPDPEPEPNTENEKVEV